MRNRLSAVSYSKDNLTRFINEFARIYGPIEFDKHYQLTYIKNYLESALKCKWMVCESHYIDREYMDAFASYYSKCLRSYPNYCQRIHFFSDTFELSFFKELLEESRKNKDTKDNKDIPNLKKITDCYQGFMVIRPQNKTFVGQTVLAVLKGEGRRFPCTRDYDVNLFGVNLKINGLAFQQQDHAVSACATAALWMAFQRVAFIEGYKIPSTVEITASATKFSLMMGPFFSFSWFEANADV
jgi:hypothetical protein